MPNIQAPRTVHAHEELQGRLEVINGQIEEADRMVEHYTRQASEQEAAANSLRRLRDSYLELLEDAGCQV